MGEIRTIEKINSGDNSTNLENTDLNIKGHAHPWMDGTQHGWVCQILLSWKHTNHMK
jgi:UDP-3-O-acyl-N-acetylglucosamine deacetylase